MSLISFRASGGISIRLDTYMRGGTVQVFTIVILPLMVKVHCLQILNKFLKVAFLDLKLLLSPSPRLLVICIPSVSMGVLIQNSP